ncbi:MAG: electron transfer flavoprotein subunit alpha/FixB family protein [Synergistaceae bacterium]|nr:electron transfer flavoprotein subunit alpha/FixB family protein [Synergistaceae bacterium]
MKKITGEVWTLAEIRRGKIHPVSTELMAWGRELADDLGAPLASLLIGDGIKESAKELIRAGADRVYVLDSPEFDNFHADIMVNAIEKLVNEYRPSILIASATTRGRTVMPMLSARLCCGLTADCTELSIDTGTRRLIQTRPAIGGNVMADIKTRGNDPQMCTVRPKSKRPLTPDASRYGDIITVTAPEDGLVSMLKYIGFEKERSVGLPLQEAEIIISGGKGMKNAKNFGKLEELALLLGGTVGASRMAVDLGWAPYSAQVGLSGKSVTPRIYMAFGISGAVQHIAGMSGAETIIAINQDPEAPIFRVADLSIQGDAMEILTNLINTIKERKGIR